MEEKQPLVQDGEGEPIQPQSVLTWPKLLGILFLACVGGAYGLEGAIGSGGPFWTIIAIIILPWIWGYPMCLMASELSASFPSNAGPIHWAYLGCGPFWTLQTTMWTLTMNCLDNALYPAMFASYLLNFFTDLCPKTGFCWPEFGLKAALMFVCVVLNIVGVEAVGWASVALTIGVISPFVGLFAGAIPFLKPKRWVDVRPLSKIEWGTFIPVVTWNLNGMDGAGHISEEVHNPQVTFNRACCGLLLLTQMVYILPVLGGVSVNDDYDKWEDGYFVQVAESLGTHYGNTKVFNIWMTVGGAIANAGFMSTLLCTTSRAIYGTAVLNIFPECISKPFSTLHPKFGTPWVAIVFNALVTLALATALDFNDLVGIDVALYSCRLIVEFVSLYRLRIKFPDVERPFKCPGGTKTIIVMSIFPATVCVANVVLAIGKSWALATLTVGVLAFIVVVGLLYDALWPDRLRQFEDMNDDDWEPHTTMSMVESSRFGGGDDAKSGKSRTTYMNGEEWGRDSAADMRHRGSSNRSGRSNRSARSVGSARISYHALRTPFGYRLRADSVGFGATKNFFISQSQHSAQSKSQRSKNNEDKGSSLHQTSVWDDRDDDGFSTDASIPLPHMMTTTKAKPKEKPTTISTSDNHV